MARATQLPTGTVTFLLTDSEGSTKHWQRHADFMGSVIRRHDELIARAVADHGGVFVKSKGEGDSTFSVFSKPTDAVSAAVDAQQAVRDEPWPDGIALRARAALHTGEAELRDGDYHGAAVNRCARIRAVAQGGQTICSQTTADLVADADVPLLSLGTHRLKDLERPERIFQLGDGTFPELRSLEAFRHNLPRQRTSFVGRERELLTLRKLLADNRLVTLTGIGGCGKTRLALQVAAEEVETFPDGVFFCELASISDPIAVPSQVAHAVGLVMGGPGGGTPRSIRQDLMDFLSTENALVVLDNCEHLVEACAGLVDDLLERCHSLRILATSREALEVEGERSFSVPSLGLASDGDAEAESVRLFCERAGSVGEKFALSKDNAPFVEEICRRLDGIPLAIELAAAQTGTLSPRQITQRLNDRFQLLTGGRLRVQRQQTLAAALDWSYDLLAEPEKTLLRRLAVFPTSFSLEAAEAICGAGPEDSVVSSLRALVAKSLVDTAEEGNERRYRLLETVRLYAEDHLVHVDEADELRTRHRDHVLEWVESSYPRASDTWEAMTDLSVAVATEAANIRAALMWCLHQDRRDLIARIAGPASLLWFAGHLDEGERWLSEGLRAETLTPQVRMVSLVFGAWIAIERLDLPAVWSRAEDALELARSDPGALGEWGPYLTDLASSQMALLCAIQASIGSVTGSAERARSFGRRALENPLPSALAGTVQIWVSLAYTALGDFEEAARVLESRADAPSASPAAAFFDAFLALLHHLGGLHPDSLASAEKAVRAFDGPTFPTVLPYRVWASATMGLALAGNGRHDDAVAFMRELLREASDLRHPGFATSITIILGAMAALRGEQERAARLLGAASAAIDDGKIRTPFDFVLRDHYVSRLRGALPQEAFERLSHEGRAMSLPAAIDLGLA